MDIGTSSKTLIFLAFLSIVLIGTFAYSNSPDAISIRVIPNSEHLSALRWYQDQQFTGSAQNLIVDGYEAVRSGRTVYVNAANVVTGQIYTNIYMISYNQEAEDETNDIFSQILNNWKFNSNIITSGNCAPDSTAQACVYDVECPTSEYCNSQKSKVIRDVKRMADTAEMKIAFENYKIENGNYPKLSAGSYLPNISLSVWPSWRQSLSDELGVKIPKDPLNLIGSCPGYDLVTCWNQDTKQFATDIQASVLPLNSFIYLYSTDQDGINYTFCAVSESSLIPPGAGSCVSGLGASGSAGNHPPEIVGVNLPQGSKGHPYLGYFKAIDADGDSISWSLDALPGAPWTNWSNAPILIRTGFENNRKLVAGNVGDFGSYDFKIQLNDGRGGITTNTFTINVKDNLPVINAPNAVYIASTTDTVIHKVEVFGDTVNFPMVVSLVSPSDTIPADITTSVRRMGNKYVLEFFGNLDTAYYYPLISPKVLNFTVQGVDAIANTNSSSFSITIKNNKPGTPDLSVCPTIARVGEAYSCFPVYSDPDGHSLTYSISTVTPTPSLMNILRSGEIIGPVSNIPGVYTISVRATDEYGYVSDSGFLTLNFQDYCGDASVQNPNMEGLGGPANDGVEQCDDGANTNDADQCYDNCSFTKCGDNILQTPNGYGVSEQCDDGANGIETDLCHDNCQLTSCGDSVPQRPNGLTGMNEECDDGSNGNQYDGCLDNCSKSKCGDGYAQKPNSFGQMEDCDGSDGLAGSPAASGITAQYACTPSCNFEPNPLLGGFCGDGIVQGGAPPNGTTGTANFGEKCDPSETKAEYALRTGDATVLTDSVYWEAIKASCVNCDIPCAGNPNLGLGCYLVGTCQKGKLVCSGPGPLVCQDVFTPAMGSKMYDYCCESIVNHGGTVTWGQSQLSFPGLARIKPASAVSGSGSFYCDDVCFASGRVCVGVALTDNPADYCYAVSCDNGNNCTASGNMIVNDCRTTYPYYIDGDDCTNPEAYHVGYTSCLCL